MLNVCFSCVWSKSSGYPSSSTLPLPSPSLHPPPPCPFTTSSQPSPLTLCIFDFFQSKKKLHVDCPTKTKKKTLTFPEINGCRWMDVWTLGVHGCSVFCRCSATGAGGLPLLFLDFLRHNFLAEWSAIVCVEAGFSDRCHHWAIHP